MRLQPIHRALAVVFVLVGLIYSNHFNNEFHFDDSHTVVENPWIRDVHNIPTIFKDATTFSTLPPNRVYRPIVTASLAVDYALGHGLKPLWFHISTFFWFMLQLGVMFLLFSRVSSPAAALAATAIYGMHPAIAETVNYLIQRGDIYSTLGVLAALAVYDRAPGLRRYGIYMLPLALAILSKPVALIFPVLLFLWITLIQGERVGVAAKSCVPSVVAVGTLAFFTSKMNPPNYAAGSYSAFNYRISQPQVLMEYFRRFFAPTDLTADTDHVAYTNIFDNDVILGFVFLLLCLGLVYKCVRSEWNKPVAFGIGWFLVTALPTSVYPLAELENDHRLYFPFVGLAIALTHVVVELFDHWRVPMRFRVAALGLTLAVFGRATSDRNLVWATDESLWHDVSVKSPKNGRGLMNYGLTLMAKGNYPGALELFERALQFNPNYYVLETNLGIAYGAVNNPAKSEEHFKRSLELGGEQALTHYFYGRWLNTLGRKDEAMLQGLIAKTLNPDYTVARYLIMQIDVELGRPDALRLEAVDFLKRFPGDGPATAYLAQSATLKPTPVLAQQPQVADTPEKHLDRSLAFYQAGQYKECVAEARAAIKLRANYAEAYNNIAAAYNSMKDWDNGIKAASEAVRLKPDFQLAKNNLAWALEQRKQHPAGQGN